MKSLRRQPGYARGFTLIELMIGLLLVALLAGIGLPLFRDFVLNQRLRAVSTDLRIALTTTRSESVKRNASMSLQPADDGWDAGWELLDPNDPSIVLLNHVQTGEISIVADPAGAVQFTPTGRAVNAVAFEIDVGTDDESTVGCLELQLDGRTISTKEACPP